MAIMASVKRARLSPTRQWLRVTYGFLKKDGALRMSLGGLVGELTSIMRVGNQPDLRIERRQEEVAGFHP